MKGSQPLFCCLDGHGSSGHTGSGKIRFCLYLLGCRYRIAEQRIQIDAAGACLSCLIMGTFHLAEDLILAHNHGLKTCCHVEQMTHSLASIIKADIVTDIFHILCTGKFQHQILQFRKITSRTGSININLCSITGTDNHAFFRDVSRDHLLHQFLLPFCRKCKQFPDSQRRIMMTDSDQ